MIGTGRATGVGVRPTLPHRPILVIADGQVAGDEINFFPIVVMHGCVVDAGVEPQEPRPAAALSIFIKAADRIFARCPRYPGGTSQPLLKSTAKLVMRFLTALARPSSFPIVREAQSSARICDKQPIIEKLSGS